MKFKLSKSQWEMIGSRAGWLKTARRQGYIAIKRYNNDEVDGSIFGRPQNVYSIELEERARMVDDSDFSERGYGQAYYESGSETHKFEISEYAQEDATNEFPVLRNADMIFKEDNDLYKRIYEYASENATEQDRMEIEGREYTGED